MRTRLTTILVFAGTIALVGWTARARATPPSSEDAQEQARREKAAAVALERAERAEKNLELKAAWQAASDGLGEGRTASKKALSVLELRVRSQLLTACVTRGDAAMKEKRFEAAEAAYAEGLQYAPNSRRAQAGLKRAGAAAKATATSPADRLAAARRARVEGDMAKRRRDLVLASRKYQECLELHPGMAACRSSLAVVLVTQGSRCKALEHMQRYVRERPKDQKTPQFRRLLDQLLPLCP